MDLWDMQNKVIKDKDAEIEELKADLCLEQTLRSNFENKVEALQAKLRVAVALLNDASPYIVQSWASVEYADIDEDVAIVKQRVDDYLK